MCYSLEVMKRLLKILLILSVAIFCAIGIAVTVVFFAMQQGALNVKGSIIERNSFFGTLPNATSTSPSEVEPLTNGCIATLDQTKPCEWNETTQFEVVKGGLLKDQAVIARVSQETGVSPRMIVAAVVPEQVRFFTDNREVFKRYFEPLKLLVSLSKFSLGVSGIKQDTAVQIENFANATTAPFYPGEAYAPLLKYKDGEDHDQVLFDRLTNEKDHYYSYLYTAIYLKQIEAQWKKAGYDISERPDVLVTLFNLGFQASQPKENPQVAGATITLGGAQYSFGYLGTLFYLSEELASEFPLKASTQ